MFPKPPTTVSALPRALAHLPSILCRQAWRTQRPRTRISVPQRLHCQRNSAPESGLRRESKGAAPRLGLQTLSHTALVKRSEMDTRPLPGTPLSHALRAAVGDSEAWGTGGLCAQLRGLSVGR